MECIENQIYYHIQNIDKGNIWNVGETYFIGKTKNSFYSYYDNNFHCIKDPTNGVLHSVNNAGLAMIEYNKTKVKNPEFESFYHFDSDQTVIELTETLHYYLRFVREIIFEEVRKDFFPNYPSRQKGIWVIPNDELYKKSINYWWKQLGIGNKRILKVSLTGKIHRANQQYLIPRTDKMDFLRQEAFKYWVGVTGVLPEENECIFEGFVNVIQEIDISTLIE